MCYLSECRAFFGAIIGSKGAVKKRIEGETRTEISIPKYGSSGDIKIIGTKRDGVCAARRRIELIVINCRRKQRPTHFNCIRIHDTTIRTNFIKFKVKFIHFEIQNFSKIHKYKNQMVQTNIKKFFSTLRMKYYKLDQF